LNNFTITKIKWGEESPRITIAPRYMPHMAKFTAKLRYSHNKYK